MTDFLSIVGCRPNLIKCGLLAPHLENHDVIHTGQHYSSDLSDSIITELQLEIHFNLSKALGISGLSTQWHDLVKALYFYIQDYDPRIVIIYGDTDSSFAGAVAASKLGIRIAHIEAGVRSWNPKQVEERNRIAIDQLSQYWFSPTKYGPYTHMKRFFCGDLQAEAALRFAPGTPDSGMCVLTMHRAENDKRYDWYMSKIAEIQCPFLFFRHPRNSGRPVPKNVEVREPCGYKEMLGHIQSARCVFTDSGGMQKECAVLGTKCVTMREETEWKETVLSGWNDLWKYGKEFDKNWIYSPTEPFDRKVYGENAAAKTAKILKSLV